MSTKPQEYAQEVREHYEELPYPHRDPEMEGKVIHASDGMNPNAVNHHAWGGKKDLRKGGRVLIAGDGTGDSSVQWAESLYGSDAEVVAIDLSSSSMEVAKKRWAKRKISDRVQHYHMSLLDLPTSGFGEFDVIECSGVLHHLEDPVAGLAALKSVLKDDGIMGIMVYAQYGRLSIYMVQDMLRRLMRPNMTRTEKIALARGFLDNVPDTHWLTVKNELFLEELRWPDGSGIYDLLLHTQDRAYTVPQLYEWVEGLGLHVAGLYGDYTNDCIYRPAHYTNSPEILAGLEGKSDADIFAIGELMNGSIAKHNFYVTKEPKSQPAMDDDMVITYGLLQSLFTGYVGDLLNALEKVSIGDRVSIMSRPFAMSPPLIVTKRPSTALLARSIDDKRTVGEIVSEVSRVGKFSRNDVRKDLRLLYQEMSDRLMVYLRHESVPPYLTVPDFKRRLQSIGVID